jgi:hypothetical protein
VLASLLSLCFSVREGVLACDFSVLSGEDCAQLLSQLSVTAKVLEAARLALAERAVACGQHTKEGYGEPASWLARQSGSSQKAAKDELALAAALQGFAATAAALSSGQISVAQAGEIARALKEVPDGEEELLDLARQSDLNKVQAAARELVLRKSSPEDLRKRQRAARHFSSWQGELGMIHFRGALTEEVGLPFLNQLGEATARLRRQARRQGSQESYAAQAADALAGLVAAGAGVSGLLEGVVPAGSSGGQPGGGSPEPSEPAGAASGQGASPSPTGASPTGPTDPNSADSSPNGATGASSTDPNSADSSPNGPSPSAGTASAGQDDAPAGWPAHCGPPPESCEERLFAPGDDGPAARPPGQGAVLKNSRRTDLVVVVDINAWRRGYGLPGEVCHILGGGPIPVSLARELGEDAFLKAVLHDGVDILRVKHFGRYRPAELQTALDLGPVPAFSGRACVQCGRRVGLEHDHVNPVANNGPTEYANLADLCWYCHDLKTARDRNAGLLKSRAGPMGKGRQSRAEATVGRSPDPEAGPGKDQGP